MACLYRQWLDKLPQLLPIALYTFLRVIVDHGNRMFLNLRQREVEFCISLLREKVTMTRSWATFSHDITCSLVLILLLF